MSAPAEALRILEQPGCPACRTAETADERWVFAFVTEHYGDAETLADLRAALGFCPAHTRPLLDRYEAPWVMRTVYAEVAAAALERLNRAGRAPPRVAPCPLCHNRDMSERTTIAFLMSVLSDPQVSDPYRAAGGFCLPHAVAALPHAGAGEALVVVETLTDRLGSADDEESLVQRLAGLDADRAARKRLRARVGSLSADCDGPRQPTATMAALRARLRVRACPACLAAGRAEGRYLAWLAHERRANPRGLAAEGLWLCPGHLHDLLEEDATTAGWVASLARFHLHGELWRLIAALSALQSRTPMQRLRACRDAFRSGGATMRAALTPFLRERSCSACRAVAAVEERETALVVAALHDAPTGRRYERSHGLCLRHVLGLETGASSTPARVLDARLRVLAWELEEAGRKSSWSVRHELKGTESTAWCRAAALIDGRVLLGARAGP